jgi:large subunit ribosomal protein L29
MRTKDSKQELEAYRGLSEEELTGKLKEAKEELFKLRFQLAIRQLDNTSDIGKVRHRIAAIQTVLRETKTNAVQTAGGTK